MARDRAELFALYEASVQNPLLEARWIAQIYRARRGRHARVLREDFCGSAALSAAWVAGRSDRRAIAIDRDPVPLAYAFLHHVLPLGAARGRVELRLADVRAPADDRADVACAYNFSYFVFKRRRELADYFRAVYGALAPGGLLFLNLFGGITAQGVSLEVRDAGGFEYIWEQARYDPLANELLAHIHFRLPDGRMIERAFTYDWRVWTIVELRELLEETGFARTHVYWQDRGPVTRVENEPAWSAYVVAER